MDVFQTHNLTAQILAAYLPHKGLLMSGDSDGERAAAYLGNIYQRLFKSIIEAERQLEKDRK